MSTSQRSTTGCGVCKTRRKKCDETKPQCLRCLRSRKTCSYEYMEYPDSQSHRMKRTKPAPRSSCEVLDKEPQATSADHYEVDATSSFSNISSGRAAILPRPVPLRSSSGVTCSSSDSTVCRSVDGSLSSLLTPSITSYLFSGIDPESIIGTSNSTSQEYQKPDLEEGMSRNNDAESAQTLIFRAPVVDKNVKENSLPFVLYCYSQWAIAIVFDPLKVRHSIREQVIAQFSFETTRTRTILIANVMEMFTKHLRIDGTRKSILDRLALEARESGSRFMSTPPSVVPAIDRQAAIRTFNNMIEVITLQLTTQPISNFIQSLESTVPVFRRACPSPSGRSVDLPSLLLDLNLNLRYFPTIDIIKHLNSGLPTYFCYEVPFSLELCEQVYHWQLQGNYGIRWLFGLPDQFLLLFAWINSLSKIPGAGDNLELIAWIEKELPRIKIGIDPDESGDPSFRIQRMVVQECWRYAVQIYLYMFLCKADAHDPRVRRAQQGYMRLIKTTKPGRRPDLHLSASVALAGLATTEELDRTTIRQRILGVAECTVQGTATNYLLLRLEDIWARTRDEGRVAVWSDLGIASSRLIHVKSDLVVSDSIHQFLSYKSA